jgi:hypothetical protein
MPRPSRPLIYSHPLFLRDSPEKASLIQRNGGIGKRKNNKVSREKDE